MNMRWVLLLPSALLANTTSTDEPALRPRVIVETDAGGDPDDEQSLVRFLLYANEFDVEGIIANRPRHAPREKRNREYTSCCPTAGFLRRIFSGSARLPATTTRAMASDGRA
jgi:hypothetical protein